VPSEEALNILMRLHPQHVCSLLATYYGLKPSSIIESVEVKLWGEFLKVIKLLGLSIAYRVSNGFAIVKDDSLNYLDRRSWERVLLGDFDADVKRFSLNEWKKVMPLSDNSIDVHDIYVAEDLDTLLDLVRLHYIKRPAHKRPKIEQELGRILGYPTCCVTNYIVKGAVRAWHDFHEKIIEMNLDQNMPVEFWAIYHVPCSPMCKHSLRLGREYLEAVKRFSRELYIKVVNELASSHLAFSVGRRFIDFKEISSSVSSKTLAEIERRLPAPRRVVVGEVLRPFSYFVWREKEYKLIITPEIMGKKFIAYSPGYGALILDESLRIFVYVTRDLLSEKSVKYASTAFRIYRSIIGEGYLFNEDVTLRP